MGLAPQLILVAMEDTTVFLLAAWGAEDLPARWATEEPVPLITLVHQPVGVVGTVEGQPDRPPLLQQ